jgi:hypothetical protein
VRVKLQAKLHAEAIPQRRRDHARARRGADEREVRNIDLDSLRGGTRADNDVEAEVLHRRIQHLLDRRA